MKITTVCITGAGRGLGRGLAEAFLMRKEVHVLAVTRNPEGLIPLQGRFGERLQVLNADICTGQGRNLVAEVLGTMPELGVLIHNAGSLVYKPFDAISEEDLHNVYKVNVFTPFLLTQRLLPMMRQTHVISISSVGGVQGSVKFGGLSAYSSSKSALNCLTEMWSEEFKGTDIVFNCLALGSVDTEMFQTAFPGFQAASTVESMSRYVVNFAFEAPAVMRGKIISLSRSNP